MDAPIDSTNLVTRFRAVFHAWASLLSVIAYCLSANIRLPMSVKLYVDRYVNTKFKNKNVRKYRNLYFSFSLT